MNRFFPRILILFILITLAGGGFFVWQYFGEQREQISDWRTIININGFEVKYPVNVTVFGVGMEVDETTAPRVIISKNPENQAYLGPFFQIDVIDKESSVYKNISLEASVQANYEANQMNKNTFVELVNPISLTVLDSKPAYTYTIISKGFSGKWSGWGAMDVPMKLKVIESENNGKHFVIVYSPDDLPFNQMLSTFKFLE